MLRRPLLLFLSFAILCCLGALLPGLWARWADRPNKAPNPDPTKQIDLYYVRGRVLLNGDPLVGAVVRFHDTGPGAFTSVTNDQGQYEIRSPVGERRISVSYDRIGNPGDDPQARPVPGQKIKLGPRAPAPNPPPIHSEGLPFPRQEIPVKYQKPGTSGLKYTIHNRQEDQVHDIKLTD